MLNACDVVHCRNCHRTEIESEIVECGLCHQDVCPHCCGASAEYHEFCRKQVDGEIDPLVDYCEPAFMGAKSD